ncbi:MAG TPA: glycosyltransferase family 4 protein [Pyrinomonadaceae bacterium]|nr:glycosyltransferase family 4 protein [Pyrinomonadaceae bacterium]
MDILICKNRFAGPISGADEIAVNYAVELKAAGHGAAVLLVQPPSDGDPLVARLRAAGVPLSAVASHGFGASFTLGRRLVLGAMSAFSPGRRLLRDSSRRFAHVLLRRYEEALREHFARRRPDVVHVITPDAGAALIIRAAHAAGVPVVYQEVGMPFHPPGFEEEYERFASVLPLCAEVTALAPRVARQMERALPQIRRPRVLPLIAPDASAEQDSDASRPPGDAVRFGFAARLEHLKGPLQLVEGFHIAHRTGGRVELIIAGDGSQRQQVVSALRGLGLEEKARLTGTYRTLEERSRFMRGIDVFVLPSLSEGTPNGLIEAMAHARPVVATAVGGVPDFVTEDVGILIPPGDPAALGAAITRLASDPGLRRSMGAAAREKYRRLFAADAVMPLLADFYRQVMNGHDAAGGGHETQRAAVPLHPWASDAAAAGGNGRRG